MTKFFAPASTDLVDSLIAEYRNERNKIEYISSVMLDPKHKGFESYFLDAQKDRHSAYIRDLFVAEPAIAVLNAKYWNMALKKTDVLSVMPAKRIDDWNNQISERKCPDFEEESVRATIGSLLDQRMQFFAERVDGVFRALSGEHVTNRPEGFFKRMIMAGFITPYDSIDYQRCNYINDLRCSIAKILGKELLAYGASTTLVESLRYHFGEWVEIDGGSLRVKLYMKGTIHIEVHPDIAWRLNEVLAVLHPRSIPASFRSKPAKKAKTYQTLHEFLPYPVSAAILSMARECRHNSNVVSSHRRDDKNLDNAIDRVIRILGGVKQHSGGYMFSYPPADILREVGLSGRIPEQKSHQFYPTPEVVAAKVAELAELTGTERVLEPSAGHGALYEALQGQAHSVTMVELSSLHCSILRAKCGEQERVIEGDFVDWAKTSADRFEVVVMNPPFDQGRWMLHLQTAVQMLTPDGLLIAVLPMSAANKPDLLGDGWWQCTTEAVFDNEFDGTSISVCVVKIRAML